MWRRARRCTRCSRSSSNASGCLATKSSAERPRLKSCPDTKHASGDEPQRLKPVHFVFARECDLKVAPTGGKAGDGVRFRNGQKSVALRVIPTSPTAGEVGHPDAS